MLIPMICKNLEWRGESVTVESRRGKISAYARQDFGVQQGNIFMAFAFNEAAANLITTAALDPFGKIPEVKYCAVKMTSREEVRKCGSANGLDF